MSEKSYLEILISVDMEGISGIVHGVQTGRERQDYEKGRKLMVGDVNAAIEGILSVGDAKIVVSDGHGSMMNIHPEDLHEAATLVRGSPKPLTQMAGINNNFDAAIFIGYHSMKGTQKGILSHTYSGKVIDSLTINGMEVGETAMNAAIAGYHGVPLIFLSGDLAVTKEAKALNSNIETVAVKEAVSRTAAKCINPKKSRDLIKEGVMKALKKRDSIEPFNFKPPIKMLVKFVNAKMADAVEFMPSAERVDGRTIRFVLDDYLEAYGAFISSVFIANEVSR